MSSHPDLRPEVFFGCDAVPAIDFRLLPASLRALLLSDGTVTRLLEAWFWEPIRIKVLAHEEREVDDLPAMKIRQRTSVLHRRTTFSGAQSGRIYCHAVSDIRAGLLWPGVEAELNAGKIGIGELFRDHRIETYRELLTCEKVPAGELAPDLAVKADDPLISRSYRIFVNRVPCIHIVDKYPIRHFS